MSSYKGVKIDNLLTLSSAVNSSLAGAGSGMPKSDLPVHNFEKPYPLGIKYKGTDISEYLKSFYKDYNSSGTFTETLPINGVNFKHISAYGWGGGGGGGGRGGQGKGCGPPVNGKTNNGGYGGTGGAGAFVAIERYPITGNTVTIKVGYGGNPGYKGSDQNKLGGKCGGSGNNGTPGDDGGTSDIYINGNQVVSAPGGTGGGGGGSGNKSSNGGNGGDGYTPTSRIASGFAGAVNPGGSYPNRNSGNGGGNEQGGTGGFVRVYYHYQ